MKRNRDNPDLIENENWTCLNCLVTARAKIFPFGLVNNYDLEGINSLNSITLTGLLPEFEITSEALKANNLTPNDIDENTPDKINCKYYTADEFTNLPNNQKSFNVMHSNVDGYECHFDNFLT